MLAYPIDLTDDDGTLLVTAPDFPELTTFGGDREEAIARAADALEEAIAARISRGEPIPAPSEGSVCAVLPGLSDQTGGLGHAERFLPRSAPLG